MALRDVTEDDLPIFFEHQQDPDANRMAAFPAREREALIISLAPPAYCEEHKST
jgi:hypothetical protein